MSWSAFTSVFKSKWMREQSPIVLVLLLILWMVYQYAFILQPADARDAQERYVASQKQLREDIQGGQERIETLHTRQLDRAFEVIETLLPPGAKRDRDTASLELYP